MVENKEKEEKKIKQRGVVIMFFFFFCKDICGVFLLGFQFLNLFTYLLAMLRGLQDLSFPSRNWTRATAVKAPGPNHWTSGELPACLFFKPNFSELTAI